MIRTRQCRVDGNSTCVVNIVAARFYREIGYATIPKDSNRAVDKLGSLASFTLDPSSPDYNADEDDPDDAEPECDYEILSVVL